MPLNLERLDRTVSSAATFVDAEQEDRASGIAGRPRSG